ncbi:MAG TPA: STM4015 family protein [Planctomycetota bacterium]|jgi:hypothetical protein
MLSSHVEELAGFKVVDFDPEKPVKAKLMYRLALDYDAAESGSTMPDLIAKYLQQPLAKESLGLIIGSWGDPAGTDSSRIVEALVAARTKLSALRYLFIGDITSEESEISWIQQTDMSPVFSAYPQLEYFRVRGNTNLSLGKPKNDALKTLIIETGGLSAEVVRQVLRASLPNLEHLELWLGTDNYGGDSTIDDLKALLDGKIFPKLKYLGLRDSENADEIAQAIASSPILMRIKTFDLSLGTLSDAGAQHLLDSAGMKELKVLDLHHHYLSDAMMKKLRKLPIEVNLDEQEDAGADGEDRYVAVSE